MSQQSNRRGRLRILILVFVTIFLVTASTGVAAAQTADSEDLVVMTGRAIVAEGETVGSVIIFDGDVLIEGTVTGDVVAFNGDITVFGAVDESILATNGRVYLEEGSAVGGDVRARYTPIVADGATVAGTTQTVNVTNFLDAVGFWVIIAWWVAVTISMLVLGLLMIALAPRAIDATLTVARERIGPAIGWGFFMFLAVPLISILLMVTLVGIPLGMIGMLGFWSLAAIGYVMGMLFLGRLIVRRPHSLALAFIVGWAILRLGDAIPVIGPIVTAAAGIYGLGALTVAAWGAAHRPEPAATGTAAAAPPAV